MRARLLKPFFGGLLTNINSKSRVKEHLVVIESDDWGAIRTPSKEVLDNFFDNGFDLKNSVYKFDALETAADLERLFEVLSRYKGANGLPAQVTANAIMANPDFQRIKDSNFQEYFYECFTDTFKQSKDHEHSFTLWKQGMKMGLFYPQLHGREHLNINRWMQALQADHPGTRFAFNNQSTYSGQGDYSYMEAFDWNSPDEVDSHKLIVQDGMRIFKETFGYTSKSFIAPCYNWDANLEDELAKLGIQWIQGISSQLAPTGNFNTYKSLKHSFGEVNQHGTKYNIRNVFFEPVNNPNVDWTDAAMARVHAAFMANVPAVISSHRVNYIGLISPINRENGLRQLDRLLKRITNKWPNVIFTTTDKLDNYIQE